MHANHKLGSSKLQEAGLQDKLQTRIGGILAGGITIKGLSNGEKRRCVCGGWDLWPWPWPKRPCVCCTVGVVIWAVGAFKVQEIC